MDMNNLQDKLGLRDEIIVKAASGEVACNSLSKNFTKIIGEITITDGLTGKQIFTFNDVIIPGATYIMEKFFNRRSTFGMTTLSTDLGINASVPVTQDNLKDELVFGFILGTGGVTPPDTVNAVYFKNKTVPTIVPLRVVSTTADLSVAEQAKYALKKQIGSFYYYYAKKFDTSVPIKHLYTDGTEIPANIDQITTSLGLLVFGEATFTVGTSDLREYFMQTYGNIDTCRFNSIGLISGFVSGTDYAGVRAVTLANLPNIYLSSSDSYYTFTYKVYAI